MNTPRVGRDIYPNSPLGEGDKRIPTGRDVEWVPLVDYRRNGVSETTIHGAIAWASGGEVIHSFGGNVLCYGRSCMKPVMLKVFAKDLEPQTNWQQRAISVASHNGQAEHVAAAQSLLHEAEWGLMQTPLDVPLVQFGRQVRRPRRWYNNSSGQHAAILKGCRLKGWSRVGYTLPHHPFFRAYMEQVRRFLGKDWQPLRVARDGDGFPTVSMTVTEQAKVFSGLAATKDEDWIWEAMIRHPDLVGGFNRLDSTVMKACNGKVIAKEGADGLLGLAIEHPEFPKGLGVMIKIAHGWNPQATWYVARAVLGVLGFELRNPYPLYKQKAFIVPGVVPKERLAKLEQIPTWDEWDPDRDRWYYDWETHTEGFSTLSPYGEGGSWDAGKPEGRPL
jgi:L-asparaginase